jgi:hypothetical protein
MAGENRRRSSVSHPLLTALPLPDGVITAPDRVQQAGWYSGITIGNPATMFPYASLALTVDSLATSLSFTADSLKTSLDLTGDTLTTSIVVTLDG